MAKQLKIYEGNIMYINYEIDNLSFEPYVSINIHSQQNDIKDVFFEIKYYFTNEFRNKSYEELYELIYEITGNENICSLTSWFNELDGSKVLILETNIDGKFTYKILSGISLNETKKERK